MSELLCFERGLGVVQAYKGLFIERAMLLLEFDVCKPWLDTAGIAQQILFINRILIGLR